MMNSQYTIPKSFYWEAARRVSIPKSLWYSWRLHTRVVVGKGSRLRVHRTARVTGPPGAMLMIGMAHDTHSGATLRMHPRSTMAISGRVQIMRGCIVSVGWDARLTIGSGTFLNDGASVLCDQQVTIGDDCAISWGVRVMDSDVHQLVRNGIATAKRASVVIGNHCWIGANSLILKGSRLGDDCVVAAGSVVTRAAGRAELLVGAPASAREGNVSWKH